MYGVRNFNNLLKHWKESYMYEVIIPVNAYFMDNGIFEEFCMFNQLSSYVSFFWHFHVITLTHKLEKCHEV